MLKLNFSQQSVKKLKKFPNQKHNQRPNSNKVNNKQKKVLLNSLQELVKIDHSLVIRIQLLENQQCKHLNKVLLQQKNKLNNQRKMMHHQNSSFLALLHSLQQKKRYMCNLQQQNNNHNQLLFQHHHLLNQWNLLMLIKSLNSVVLSPSRVGKVVIRNMLLYKCQKKS